MLLAQAASWLTTNVRPDRQGEITLAGAIWLCTMIGCGTGGATVMRAGRATVARAYGYGGKLREA